MTGKISKVREERPGRESGQKGDIYAQDARTCFVDVLHDVLESLQDQKWSLCSRMLGAASQGEQREAEMAAKGEGWRSVLIVNERFVSPRLGRTMVSNSNATGDLIETLSQASPARAECARVIATLSNKTPIRHMTGSLSASRTVRRACRPILESRVTLVG